MPEIELKFVVDESAARQLRARLRRMPAVAGRPRTRTLRSVYHDTPDHALAAAGVALRLRRDGRRWLQTVKARSSLRGGLSQAEEAECPAPAGRLSLDAIPDEALKAQLLRLVDGKALAPVCETLMRRTTSELALGDGTRVEVAIDAGEIVAGGTSVPFREAEVELIEGNVGALYELARELFPAGTLRFSHLSKVERGYRLARGDSIDDAAAPRAARAVAIAAGMTAEQAAREVLRECFDQIAVNRDVVLEHEDAEGPHQLRIGLRRLRSAFALFEPAIGSPELERRDGEARWLAQEVGGLRDLDVARADIVEPEALAHPDEAGFAVLLDALGPRTAAARKAVREALGGVRTQGFLLDLARFVESRGWLVPADMDQSRRLATPVEELAGQALDRRWKAIGKRARRLEDLGVPERHELRKELKKLRYAIEFLAPLYPAKRVRSFARRLRDLQAAFGDLNDAAVARALFSGEGAPGAADLAAARASGWIIGAQLARAEHGWDRARSLWSDLREAKPYWR